MKGKRRKSTTAAELMDKLSKDAGYQARRAAQEERLRVEEAAGRAEEAGLSADLERVGVEAKSAWDLVNRGQSYVEAVPVLLDHLQRDYSDRTKEGIARALAVPEAVGGWHILMSEFERNPDKTAFGSKFGVGCALAATARANGRYDEVLRLLREEQHGESRAALLEALALSKDPKARSMLREFVDDPVLGEQTRWYLKHPGRPRR